MWNCRDVFSIGRKPCGERWDKFLKLLRTVKTDFAQSLEIYSQHGDFFNSYINILMYLYILSFLYLLGAGPRPSIRIPQWPWDVQLYQKDHGPVLSPRSGNTANVPESSARSYWAAPAVHSVCFQYVDSWNNLEPSRLNSVQTCHTHQQRHWGLAPWPQSPSLRTWPAADVPSYQAPSQRGYADSHPDPSGVWEETEENTASHLPWSADKDLQAVGRVWRQWKISEKFTESLFPS